MIERNGTGTDDDEQADSGYETHIRSTTERVSTKIVEDIDHQLRKFGSQRLSGLGWIAVVGEEWGETIQGYLNQNPSEAKKEAMQTVACLVRLIVEIEREEAGLAEREQARYVRPC